MAGCEVLCLGSVTISRSLIRVQGFVGLGKVFGVCHGDQERGVFR